MIMREFKISNPIFIGVILVCLSFNIFGQSPGLSGIEGFPLQFTEGDAPTIITSLITISDTNSYLISATVSITNGFKNPEDILALSSSLTTAYDPATGILSISGVATLGDYQNALQNITYQNTSVNPDLTTRTISFQVTDSFGTSLPATRDITIIPVNNAPVLSGIELSPVTYTEGVGTIAITSAITVADVDNANLSAATVTISTGYINGEDLLSIPAGPVTGSFNASTGILTLSGNTTVANYQAALRSVTYLNTSQNPNTAARTISFVVNDGSASSNIVTRNITIIPVNNAPVLSGIELSPVSYTEGVGATAITSAITVADVDNANLSSATVTISTGYINGEDLLSISAGPVTGSFNASTGILTLSGNTTVANYQAALRSVTYLNTSQNPNTAARTISFVVNDGSASSNIVTRNISITPVNNAPVLSGIELSPVAYTEGDAATTVTSTLTISDVDNTTLASATITITGYISSEDTLILNSGPLSLSYNKISGVLNLTGPSTIANFQSALRSIKYLNSNTSNPNNGNRTISFEVNDGGANSNIETRTIQVTAINNPPVLSQIETSHLVFTEDDPFQFITQNILVADADNSSLQGATIRIDQNFDVTEDSLTYNTVAGITPIYNQSSGLISATGSASVAAYQSFLRSVRYKNFDHFNPSPLVRRVSFVVNDGTDNSNTVRRLIDVIPVNDPPTASGAYIQGTNFFIHDLLTAKYTYFDPNSDPQGNSIVTWYTSTDNLGTERAVISGAVSDTFAIQFPEGGKYIGFTIRPFDNKGLEGTPDSSIWYYINAAPVFQNFTVKNLVHPGAFAVGETVSADFTYFDKESDAAGAHEYQWYRSVTGSWGDAVIISAQTAKQYLITSTDLGKYIGIAAKPHANTGSNPGSLYQSSWFGVGSTPSAVISGNDSICNDGSKGILTVTLTGSNPPWSFTYKVNNGTPVTISNISSGNATYQLQVSDTGTYSLINVSDAVYLFGTVTGSGKIEYYKNPGALLTQSSLSICDNDNATYNIPFTLTGKAPWSIVYSKNGSVAGTINNILGSPSSFPVQVSANGTYTISSVSDVNCHSTGIGSTQVIVRSNPKATISGSPTVCPGDTASLNVALSGTGPWVFHYKRDNSNEDSIQINQNLSSYNYTLKSNNSGLYTVTRVTDQTQEGCVYGTGTIQNFALPTASLSGSKSTCEGTNTTLNVQLTGVSPWNISYKVNNGASKGVNNITQNPYPLIVSVAGNYIIDTVKDANCESSGTGSANLTIIPAPVLQINLSDTIFSRTTVHTPISFTPSGGSYMESDKSNAIQFYSGTLSYWPILADTAGSPYWLRYKYTDPVTTCLGKDSLRVFVVANDGNIQVDNPKSMYCSYDNPIEIFGLNVKHKTGYFTIDSFPGGLIDNGNNSALLLPSVLKSGTRIVSYHYLDGTVQTVPPMSFSFEKINAGFWWDNECFGDSSVVGFTDTTKVIPGSHKLTSHLWEFYLTDNIVTRNTAKTQITFTKLGSYMVKDIVTSEFGCSDTITKQLNLKATIPVYDNPYTADFTNGSSNWSSYPTVSGSVNSWTFGTPTGQIFHAPAGQKAWYTNITKLQQPEQSYILSPCFDFSGSDRPMIKMDIWRAFTPNLDGAVLQYSITYGSTWINVGDLDDGINWYNSHNIEGNPGGQGIGWTNAQDNNWITSKHALDDLQKQKIVIFRIAYGAVGVNLERDGIAFRNIWIGERSKKILLEYFTNAGDSVSRKADVEFNSLVNINANDAIDIQYHLGYPGPDTFYVQNPLPFDTRELYYGIENVPYAILDGGRGNDPAYLFDFSLKSPVQKDFSLAVLSDNSFDINLATSKSGDNINIDAGITALSALNNHILTLHIVIVERLITINSQANFQSVLRDEVPDVSGTTYSQTWTAGSTQQVHFTWPYKNIFNPKEIRVVAYIQDETSKEIYQAAISNPDGPTAIETPANGQPLKFQVYPNPAKYSTFLHFNENLINDSYLQIFDDTGGKIYNRILYAGTNMVELTLAGIRPGIYIIRVSDKLNVIGSQKLIILNNKN